jgi:LPXTG-motif cell wall-anchored protein
MNGNLPLSGPIPLVNGVLLGAIVVALIVAAIVWFKRRR